MQSVSTTRNASLSAPQKALSSPFLVTAPLKVSTILTSNITDSFLPIVNFI